MSGAAGAGVGGGRPGGPETRKRKATPAAQKASTAPAPVSSPERDSKFTSSLDIASQDRARRISGRPLLSGEALIPSDTLGASAATSLGASSVFRRSGFGT